MTPRKNVPEAADKTDGNAVRKDRRKPFRSKRIYLDLKSRASATIRQLVDDIIFHGGTIEEFFSREVTHVVTDAPEARLKSDQQKQPLTPQSGILSPSPSAFLNNPWSSLSPATAADDRPKAKSRAEAIIERSRQQNSIRGTQQNCDIIDCAKKWGIQLWHLDKLIKWIEDYKTGSLAKRQSTEEAAKAKEQLPLEVRHFHGSYIKFESNDCRFRPVFHEFGRFPKLYLAGRAGSSPFYCAPLEKPQITKQQQQSSKPKRTVVVSTVSNPNKYKFRRIQEREVTVKSSKSSKGKQQQAKKKEEQKEEEVGIKESRKDKKPGYCEICEVAFTSLAEHLEDENHGKRVEDKKLWAKLDESLLLANQLNAGGHEAMECSV